MTGAGIVVVLAASAFFGWLYFRARAGNSSVPAGEIVSQDTENLEILEPLVSHSLRGSGANCEVAQIRTVPLHRSDSDIDRAAPVQFARLQLALVVLFLPFDATDHHVRRHLKPFSPSIGATHLDSSVILLDQFVYVPAAAHRHPLRQFGTSRPIRRQPEVGPIHPPGAIDTQIPACNAATTTDCCVLQIHDPLADYAGHVSVTRLDG